MAVIAAPADHQRDPCPTRPASSHHRAGTLNLCNSGQNKGVHSRSLTGRDAAYSAGPVRQCCTRGPNLATSSSIDAEAIGSILAT